MTRNTTAPKIRWCPSIACIKEHALIGFRGLMLQALSEKHNSFLRPLKKKGFKEERVTIIGLYDIGKSHDPGIQQEPSLYKHLLRSSRRNVSPVELIDGPFLMRHKHLACAAVELLEVAKVGLCTSSLRLIPAT